MSEYTLVKDTGKIACAECLFLNIEGYCESGSVDNDLDCVVKDTADDTFHYEITKGKQND